jgi:hypothetical protein
VWSTTYAADGQRAAEDDAEKHAHVRFLCLALPISRQHGAIVNGSFAAVRVAVEKHRTRRGTAAAFE